MYPRTSPGVFAALLEKCLESWEARDLEELDRLLTRFAADIEALTQKVEKA